MNKSSIALSNAKTHVRTVGHEHATKLFKEKQLDSTASAGSHPGKHFLEIVLVLFASS